MQRTHCPCVEKDLVNLPLSKLWELVNGNKWSALPSLGSFFSSSLQRAQKAQHVTTLAVPAVLTSKSCSTSFLTIKIFKLSQVETVVPKAKRGKTARGKGSIFMPNPVYIILARNLGVICILWLFLMHRHETYQVEIPNAHDNSERNLAWHPIGYLLCRWIQSSCLRPFYPVLIFYV